MILAGQQATIDDYYKNSIGKLKEMLENIKKKKKKGIPKFAAELSCRQELWVGIERIFGLAFFAYSDNDRSRNVMIALLRPLYNDQDVALSSDGANAVFNWASGIDESIDADNLFEVEQTFAYPTGGAGICDINYADIPERGYTNRSRQRNHQFCIEVMYVNSHYCFVPFIAEQSPILEIIENWRSDVINAAVKVRKSSGATRTAQWFDNFLQEVSVFRCEQTTISAGNYDLVSDNEAAPIVAAANAEADASPGSSGDDPVALTTTAHADDFITRRGSPFLLDRANFSEDMWANGFLVYKNQLSENDEAALISNFSTRDDQRKTTYVDKSTLFINSQQDNLIR